MLLTAGFLLPTILLQDSSSVDTSRSRLTALPVGSYSEVTGLQYGATVFRGFRVDNDSLTRASTISAYAARTAKSHAKAYVQLDRWSPQNASRWRARAEFISYPLPLFGIGADTPESAEEWYSSGVTTLQAFTERRLRGPAYLHVGARYVRSRLRAYEAGGLLEEGTIPGAAGSDMFMTELGLVIDSRDHTGAPRTGTYVRAIPSYASKSAGSDFTLRRLTLDAREYRPLGSNYVAAFQLQYDGVSGIAPFDLMPMIGADTAMRGYPRGRYRDRHAFASQVEIRSPYWRRLGLVTFAGVGTVSPSLSTVSAAAWYPTFGAGLRYAVSPRERTVLRADLGMGRGTFGVSLGIGEAF